ncbi:hypothetical protein FEM48_Zijuj09G0195700 [Ziziphus jujuba var. spinosa]|uniref:Isopenicillin N synthase-like Fe(2+) 2OG dioxygenase domain-containing protein n=1 Tax=Ziziphus jujuba var. spinosa TaxID=714518 RepID=A0A978UUX1_ZIZJJ|nr:hypothetical protein FEM48_Zijuj09G0195700 [Ziziphus jujuba var. spinosa]
MNLESEGLQLFAANLYPPCPQPEFAMGLPHHSDLGLLTLVIHNGIDGLQIQHNGNWFNVNTIPNSILYNIGDHLEQWEVQKCCTSNSSEQEKDKDICGANGPALETIVSPAPKLVDNETHLPVYIGIECKNYFHFQQGNQLYAKSCLERLSI